MATIQGSSSILIYRVGPVYCCSPCISVISISHPAPLTKLPGQKSHHSGIFKFNSNLVNVCELRSNFGVDPEQWLDPGRIIITKLNTGYVGFWVDEIIDVMEPPSEGWGNPPPLIPRTTFSKTLNLNNEIHLYSDFENINSIRQTGYLKAYIAQLEKLKTISKKTTSNNEADKLPEINNKNNKNSKTKSIDSSFKKTEQYVPSNKTDTDNITPTPTTTTKKSISVKNISEALTTNKTISTIKNNQKITTKIKKPNKTTKIIKSSDTKLTKDKIIPRKKIKHKNTTTIEKREFKKLNTQRSFSSWLIGILLFFPIPITAYFLVSFQQSRPTSELTLNDQLNSEQLETVSTELITVEETQAPKPEAKQTIASDNITSKKSNDTATTIEETKNIQATTQTKPALSDNINSSLETNTEKVKKILDIPDYKNTTVLDSIDIELGINIKGIKDNNHSAKLIKDSKGITIKLYTPLNIETTDQENLNIKSKKITNHSSKNQNNRITKQKNIIKKKRSTLSPSIISKEIIHIVVKGDTLWHIAKFYVDDPYRYPELARLSHIKNPDLIYPGDRVHIIQIFENPKSQKQE
ncbi:hypothetical protein MNBD_GAMMA22-3122 [hydrothermal vent metagenome]|uniref:LysM domain-containing protein n=1 Tax=hydrothermal vent metagenome TaxID=652676 RepID=A0A3B1A6D1_9ZZZZ